jgi:hypothetical protein
MEQEMNFPTTHSTHKNRKNLLKMKLFLLLALPFFTLLHENWYDYTATAGKFKVKTPGAFSETTTKMKTGIGTLEYHTFTHESKEKDADNIAYVVSYCDYPAGTVHADSTELADAFFEATIAASVSSVRGELMYTNDISTSHEPARLWRTDYHRGEYVIKTKAFLVKNRYYAAQVVTHRAKSLNPSVDIFLEGLKVIGD